MNRKKAIKEKQESIDNLNLQIIDTLCEAMKVSVVKSSKKDSLIKLLKIISLGERAKVLETQKKMAIAQPIPPKHFKKGRDLVGEKETEMIITNKNEPIEVHLNGATGISITVPINRNIIIKP